MGEAVAASLGLPNPVLRFECFDISHLQGEAQVASLRRLGEREAQEGGVPVVQRPLGLGPDDPAAIAEAVERRYSRRAAESAPLPDLVLLDGGREQLKAALGALAAAGCALPAAALAKRLEEIVLPGRARPLLLEANDSLRLLFQRVRDEAHRFAVTRHRTKRRARTLATQLLAVPGIGARRARVLLRVFGSVDGVRAAGLDALAGAIGKQAAGNLWRVSHRSHPTESHRPEQLGSVASAGRGAEEPKKAEVQRGGGAEEKNAASA